MTNLDQIKARYPDWQKNALGKIDMDNIHWLITEVERLQSENKRLLEKARLFANEAMNLDADVAKLKAHQELFEEVAEAATEYLFKEEHAITGLAVKNAKQGLKIVLIELKEQNYGR